MTKSLFTLVTNFFNLFWLPKLSGSSFHFKFYTGYKGPEIKTFQCETVFDFYILFSTDPNIKFWFCNKF